MWPCARPAGPTRPEVCALVSGPIHIILANLFSIAAGQCSANCAGHCTTAPCTEDRVATPTHDDDDDDDDDDA